MKQKLLFVFCVYCLGCLSLNLFSQNTIEIKASALYKDKPVDNYAVLIYQDGILKDSVFAKKTKPITLTMESNKIYSIVFKKENCPTKFVIANTDYLNNIKDSDQEPFDLQIEISPEVTKIKKEFNDYPVALLYVNKTKRLFMANETYFQLTRN
jgi:hypothetical protein